jgi:phage baseplate assembly protein W
MGALENDLNPDTWIGLSFPLGRSESGFFQQTKTTLEQTSHNIKNLLLTMKGERPYLPEFGSDLYTILFDPIRSDTTIKVEEAIKDALKMWLPHVVINRIDVNTNEQNSNQIDVSIEFGVTIEPGIFDSLQLTFFSNF